MGISRTAVVGGGTMGAGIAQVLAAAGCTVTLVEADGERRAHLPASIMESVHFAVRRGRIPQEAVTGIAERLAVAASVGELEEGLDLVVEAVPERLDLKRGVLAAIEARSPRVISTNTSGLGIGDLGAGLRRPEALVGTHFFNPVPAMPLLEVVVADATGPAALAAARELAALTGKETITVRDRPGFATSRLGVALGLEAIRMLEEGVAPAEDIDRAMELGYRHPMGPLRLTDLVGLDVRLDIARNLESAYGPRFAPPRLLEDKVAAGHLGRKSGQGFYTWEDR